MSTLSSEKKKEYNKRYRDKLKQEKMKAKQKNDTSSDDEEEIIKPIPKPKPKVQFKQPVEEPTELPNEEPNDENETFTIDKSTMNYLIECLKDKKDEPEDKPKEDKPKETSNESSFFLTVKNALIQQMAITGSMIALKLIVDGTKSSIPSMIQNIIKPVKDSSTEHTLRTVNLE